MNTTSKTMLAFSLIVMVFVITFVVQSHLFLSWDVVWYGEAAERLLKGGHYTQNFFEPNPPLVIFISLIPIGLSKILSIPMETSVRLFTLAIASLSLWLVYGIKPRIFLLLILLFIYCFVPLYEFGQRSHLMLMMIMPYLFSASLVVENKKVPYGFMIGLLAGIGFCFKPYYAVTFFLVEIVIFWKSQSFKSLFRSETIAIFTIVLLYFLSILIWTPDYLTVVLPMVITLYISHGKTIALELMRAEGVLLWGSAFILFFIGKIKASYQDADLLTVLIIASFGMAFSYFIQAQTWYYHEYPLIALSFLIVALLGSEMWRRVFSIQKYIYIGVTGIIAVGFIAFIGLKITKMTSPNYVYTRAVQEVIAATQAVSRTGPIYVFSTSMEPRASLHHKAGYESASRFPDFWMIAGIVQLSHQSLNREKKGLLNQQADQIRQWVVEDFEHHAPCIVLIDIQKPNYLINDPAFQYLDFLTQNASFAALWKRYHYQITSHHYAIYKRNDCEKGATRNLAPFHNRS